MKPCVVSAITSGGRTRTTRAASRRITSIRRGSSSSPAISIARSDGSMVASSITRERDAALARLTTTTGVNDLAGCDLVVEAVVEELDVKQALFRELDAVVGENAVLATNTSALSVTAIAEGATAHPERVVGMHFFNPAPVLPLVEVVRTELSSYDAVETAYALAERLGKEPIRCGDTPGFVVNRILIPLLNDCVRVLDAAGVTPDDLDKAMTRGVSWPIGPCALIDLIGVDVHVHASEALHEVSRRSRAWRRRRGSSACGTRASWRKAGRGFFAYEG